MNKTELIEKISGNIGIPESEQKLFFEMLLKRCAEVLNSGESLMVSGLGKFEFHKAHDKTENDLIIFMTNDNDELHFDIPEKEESALDKTVDSYFSISIGKPVIPLKGASENEFFIPHSGDEMKRMLELKVEKFIEEAFKTEIEAEEQKTSDITDIQFSFLNWKRSSNINEEINQIEQELDESFSSEVSEIEKKENEIEQEIESESLIKEEAERIESETPDIDAEETKESIFSEDIEEELNKAEKIVEIKNIEEANEELISEDPDDKEELMESTEEWVDDLVESGNLGTKNAEEEISEQIKISTYGDFALSPAENKEEEIPSYLSEKKKIKVDDDESAISEAFKYAEDKKTRIESYRKRSFGGLIFAAVIIIATAGVVYFSYYFTEREISVIQQTSETRKFKTVIERSFNIPVSYPYQTGMFAGIYNAINNDILNPVITEEPSVQQNTEVSGNSNSKVPEIRSVLQSNKIKGYIYQYNDGTFAVQVSSWKSRSVAVSETQKYLNKGYDAFIEVTGLSGGTYYRVRVGGFKSLKEAEDFSRK